MAADDPTTGAGVREDLPPLPPRLSPRRRRRRRLVAWIAGSVAVVVLLAGLGGFAAARHILDQIHKINVFGGNQPADGATGDETILLVGSDSRAGLTAAQEAQLSTGNDPGQRSDTMLLLHIPKGGGKVELVSLPRDSLVTIPAWTAPNGSVTPAHQAKLNAAYSEGGARLTVQTVEQATHVHIDHYVEINFLGFVTMVDKLGGITVCLPSAINDPYRRGQGGTGLELSAGTHTLDGAQALKFVRAREFDPGEGDLGRIHRQQQFMASMLQKAESTGVLLDLPKLYGFLSAVSKSLTTDEGFGIGQMKKLAGALHNLSPSHVEMTTVPLKSSSGEYVSGLGDVVEWDPVLSTQLFTDINDDRPITSADTGVAASVTVPPSAIHVTVLNATGTNGFAATVAGDLAQEGFPSPATGDAPAGSDPKAVVVRYGSNRADSAKTVAAAVPGATLVLDPSLGSQGLELVVGSSFHGVQRVKVAASPSAGGSSGITVRTGAQTGCTA